MPVLGAHQSIAGGYYKAVEIAQRTGCDCVQVFTKNNNQWQAKPITDEQAAAFRAKLAELAVVHPLAHDSYLINLGSPDDALWRRSIDAFVVEILRADQLGIPYVVAHPGSYTTSSELAGLERIVAALDEVHAQTRTAVARCLLENTAGQGSNLGWRFEHLATILDGVREPERMGGACLDTCHLFAAGYPFSTPADYDATMSDIDRLVGLDRVRAVHLNDSKSRFGSRVDRHAHIGRGEIGVDAFRLLLNDARFASTPMYLETPKETIDGEEMDVVNLRTLRSLVDPG